MIFFIAILLFALSIVVNLALDYKKILDEGRLNHKRTWYWIRKALFCLPSVVCFAIGLWDSVKWLWCICFSSAMVAFAFYLVYDPLLNLLRGFGIFYRGTPDEWDSGTEKLERLLPAWLSWLLKFAFAIGFTYLYIQLL